MTAANKINTRQDWLSAEPGIIDYVLADRLTAQLLQPYLPEIECYFLALRQRVDQILALRAPQKYGKTYPLSQCLEISRAVRALVDQFDAADLPPPAQVGCRAIRQFLTAGGQMRRVWGDLRGAYFQNAFQIGTLYVDVANDTVVPTKPKVEIMPFAQSGLSAIKDYHHFARIAQRYWGATAWPNHLVPRLAPFFPVLFEAPQGGFSLHDMGGYMIRLNLRDNLRPAQAFLNDQRLPDDVHRRAAADLAGLRDDCAGSALAGQRAAMNWLAQYRRADLLRDQAAQKKLLQHGQAVNTAFTHAARARALEDHQLKNEKPQKMNILFLHQNFPGQFKHLAPALVGLGHNVVALSMKAQDDSHWQGVQMVSYAVTQGSTSGIHPWVVDFETKVIRAEGAFRACLSLNEQGFKPDVIIAHPGWGESLFVKEVWPQAKLGIFCEFFYLPDGADTGFDPEFPVQDQAGNNCRLRLKNLNNYMHFDVADGAIAPTTWQASTFPEPFRSKITVVHDGIDTAAIQPNPQARLQLHKRGSSTPMTLTRADEVITFVNRNLEPMRGYHVFMRALPQILRDRPNAQVIMVGGDGVSYGAKPTLPENGGTSWKQIFIDEVRGQITDADWSRVHFVGQVPYDNFVGLLQLSTVHVYLTYPFVLSWSLIEAMSAGAAIVASDTAPLREVISHDENGILVDFFDVAGLVNAVCALLDDPDKRSRLGAAARRSAVTGYDLNTICLPQQIAWVETLSNHTNQKGDAYGQTKTAAQSPQG